MYPIKTLARVLLFSTAVLLCSGNTGLYAQSGLFISRDADFSSQDHTFDRDDVLHIKVVAPQLDAFDLKHNSFWLKPSRRGQHLRGSLENNLDGTYTAAIPLGITDDEVSDWELRIHLRDDNGHAFRARLDLQIGEDDHHGHDDDDDEDDDDEEEIQLTGRITQLTDRGLRVNDVFFRVTDDTKIQDRRGERIRYSALRLGMLVKVEGERDDDDEPYTAEKIKVLDDDFRSIVVRGEIERLGDHRLTVAGRTFRVTEDTRLRDAHGHRLDFEDLRLGQFVLVEGFVNEDGHHIARHILVVHDRGDDQTASIEMTGRVNSVGDGQILVDDVLFRLADHTEVRDAEGDAMRIGDLRRGALVSIRGTRRPDEARFRAERIEVEDEADLPRDAFSLEAAITALGDDVFSAGGFRLHVSDDTEFFDADGNAIDYEDLQVEDPVAVDGLRAPDGTLHAHRVEVVEEDDAPEQIEWTGRIIRLAENGLQVDHLPFNFTDDTEIVDAEGDPLTDDDLHTGQLITIRGERTATSERFDATEIALHDAADEDRDDVEVEGPIDNVDEDGLTVAGFRFDVTDDTEIIGEDGQALDLEDLKAGDDVDVDGYRRADGTYLAERIEVEADDHEEPHFVEATGKITRLAEDRLQVDGKVFHVTDNTKVLDQMGESIAFEDLETGLRVNVQGWKGRDGTLYASRIRVLPPEDDDDEHEDELEVTAELEAIGDGTITVGGFTFEATDDTEVRDEDGHAIDVEDLAVGDLVHVEAHIRADRTLVARKVERVERENEVELTGRIDEVLADGLVVSGIAVEVDDDTEILDEDEEPLLLQDLRPGMLVDIQAELQGDGSILARRIQVEERIEDEVVVTGVVEDVGMETLEVLGRTFHILATTELLDEDGNAIDLNDLAVGETVEIRGDLLPGGDLVAHRVQVQTEDAERIYVVGPVEAAGGGTLEVIGIHFFVDGNTEVLDEDGNAIALDDLTEGETVEVEAEGQPNGTRLATRIQVKDVTMVSGRLAALQDGSVTLVGTTFSLNAGTLVLGADHAVVSRASLAVGQRVAVRSVREGTALVATKIQALEGSTAQTGTETTDEALPESFLLEQNYPNPFNPSTTIPFELRAGDAQVTLAIYNVLGQHVRTLYEGTLPAGTHRYTWNGRDQQGRAAASGIYLYRLQIARQVQTRTMTLLK